MVNVPRIVLASTSRYRRELMDRLGVEYEAVAPDYEEEHALGLPPDRLVVELAVRKARSLEGRFPGALILGSDQVAEIDGEVLLKPGTAARARAQLARLSGRTHRLLTGVALVAAGSERVLTALDVHRMRMRHLAPEQVSAYVERDEPVDCAGSYKVEKLGIALFEAVEGKDFTAVIGLPLTRVVALLETFGVRVPGVATPG